MGAIAWVLTCLFPAFASIVEVARDRQQIDLVRNRTHTRSALLSRSTVELQVFKGLLSIACATRRLPPKKRRFAANASMWRKAWS